MAAHYGVKLAPGEAVVLPGRLGLTLGGADPQSFPRFEAVQTARNWIVQPISVHGLTATERAQFEAMNSTPYSEKRLVSIVDREGRTRGVSVPLFSTRAGERLLFARLQIEVETRK